MCTKHFAKWFNYSLFYLVLTFDPTSHIEVGIICVLILQMKAQRDDMTKHTVLKR